MNILVSGLVNTETSAAVRGFPVAYYPIDYPFFGVETTVSGVAYNLSKALVTLGDRVRLTSMVGEDFPAAYIRNALEALSIGTDWIRPSLRQTPCSVVLYDPQGRRQIYCDLKDIQETAYPFTPHLLEGVELVAACNINFNRPLLRLAKELGKPVATDVHVLSNIYDDYNREFMECADILFLSDEGVGEDYQAFLWQLAHTYGCEILVMGRGSRGASLYQRKTDAIIDLPPAFAGKVVNTVGAGDALFSAFLHFYGNGWGAVDALNRAQKFAACKIAVSGASNGFVTEEEVQRRMGESGRQ